jgi:uncharacterized protein YjbI with pentapeptide repeats
VAIAQEVDWETCTVDACVGARLAETGRCLAHLAQNDLATALDHIASNGHVDARGVQVSGDLLKRILDAVRGSPKRKPTFKGETTFDWAVFKEHASFDSAIFEGAASFTNATFERKATFENVVFNEEAVFNDTTFKAASDFTKATFMRDAWFSRAELTFADFFDASFERKAYFDEAIFRHQPTFNASRFASEARFDDATFEGNEGAFLRGYFKKGVSFNRVTFEGFADFSNAPFNRTAEFKGTVFKRNALFGGAIFWHADFDKATFKGIAWFKPGGFADKAAAFRGDVSFRRVIFERSADFYTAAFRGEARFDEATFEADAGFDGATFKRNARFEGATFQREAQFNGAIFEQDASFGATFERARTFGPTLVVGTLSFADASFLEKPDLDLVANRLVLSRARFPVGVNVWTRWAEIFSDKADFGAPSILGASSEFERVDEAKLAAQHRDSVARSWRPRLISLRWANVGDLTVSGIDLAACRFFGAHHLDGLRLEAGSFFAFTPRHYRVTRRQAIAEEHAWRKAHAKRSTASDWFPPECRLPRGEEQSSLSATDVATVYRDLRKGREDNKDEPGAADFYYGEMEMRRFDGTKTQAERVIIWIYWLVSGYGLRASRSLLSLVATVLVFAALLYAWGFPSHESFLDSVTFSAESTTSLLRAPRRSLTVAGEWLQIGLRLLGPLFFGLALLSIRGRIKR